jgi:hypothetical protein
LPPNSFVDAGAQVTEAGLGDAMPASEAAAPVDSGVPPEADAFSE